MNWLAHVLGMDNLSGPWYGFWSGFGSDVGEFAIVGALLTSVRRHNCHIHRCWRIGRFPATINDRPYVVCRLHHAHPVPTRADISGMGSA